MSFGSNKHGDSNKKKHLRYHTHPPQQDSCEIDNCISGRLRRTEREREREREKERKKERDEHTERGSVCVCVICLYMNDHKSY